MNPPPPTPTSAFVSNSPAAGTLHVAFIWLHKIITLRYTWEFWDAPLTIDNGLTLRFTGSPRGPQYTAWGEQTPSLFLSLSAPADFNNWLCFSSRPCAITQWVNVHGLFLQKYKTVSPKFNFWHEICAIEVDQIELVITTATHKHT